MIKQTIKNAKYTVIASAARSNLTESANIGRHIDAQFSLSALGYNRFVDVKGFYRETQADFASVELSRAIPVHTLAEVQQLATLFCGAFNQDCILAVNNETLDCWLVNLEGELFAKLGKWTMHSHKDSSWNAYTYDGAFYYTAE